MSEQENLQKKFEERYEFFMNDLSIAWDKNGVKTSIAIVVDPEMPENVIIHQNGSTYDKAKIIAQLLRIYKKEIEDSIST